MQIKILSLLTIMSLFVACIEEFNPKIDGYLDLLVIDGMITNEPGPYIVRLSKTLAVDDLDYFPVTGANIVIFDDFDTEETLVELEPGVYSTNPLGIRGEVGRKYRITIDVDGKTYQSDFEELEEPVGIDSIYAKVEYKETVEGSFEGVQFYIDTETTNTKQFLWVPIETYEYKGDLELNYVYWSFTAIDTITNPSLKTCWRTEKVIETLTFSTKGLTYPKIKNFPLHYVNTSTKKLSERYSVLINQYSITEEAYKYWNEIKKQSAESGSLYTTQPFQVKGNLINPNNPKDIILGYFWAAGVSKKRVFVEKPPLNFTYSKCEGNVQALIDLKGYPPPWPVYVTTVKVGIEGKSLGMADVSCFDCKENGGTEEKPEFWED